MADTHAAAEFYATAQGALAARLVRERLALLWPDMAGQTVLGLGYAIPYLRPWREGAARCIAATPAQVGEARWPLGGPNLTCTVEEDTLPFPDLLFDRVLLVHGLEAADNARRLLREVWRVLKDDGRLIVVAPNRTGLWTHAEGTPFGHGQPFSHRQIGRLLSDSLFRVERRDSALWMPPSDVRIVLRSARLWERGGRRLLPRLSGVTITDAVKDLYAAVPHRRVRRRLVLAEAG